MHLPELKISQGARVRFRRAAINPDGSVSWFDRGHFTHNLILDSGLDSIAVRSWAESFTHAAVGTGTNPFERDSGSTTFTATAGAVVASAGFFAAGDVGRLLRLDSGEQGYITAFTDSQNVTWSGPDGGPSQGTIYYVNRTALQTETKRTSTYRTSSGDNGSTWNGTNGEWTLQRTFLFSTESGSVTYREIGWSWGANPTALFGGAILPGAGDSLVAGQQYLVQMQLILRLSPTSPVAAPNVGSGGWNTEGDISIASVRMTDAFWDVASNGAAQGGGGSSLEPFAAGSTNQSAIALFTQSGYTLSSASNGIVTPPTGLHVNNNNYTVDSYASGTFTRTKSYTFGISEANATHWGVCLFRNVAANVMLVVKFDAGQVKANTHTLTVRFRWTWGRRFP